MKELSLLRRLYNIHAPTGYEWKMIRFMREYVTASFPEVVVQIDSWGNLYMIKGNAGSGYPTLACHLDQVQKLHSEDFEVRQDGDKLYGWSEQNQRQEGLGADDKNGIWICLRCLKECPKLKVFMAVGEEKGCIGSNRADMNFFENSLYVLEPDCKGGKEIHTVLRDLPCASEDFINALQAEANGYTITEGKTSDIYALTLNDIGVSCANIPAGYHQSHKDDEYTLMTELVQSFKYIKQTILRLDSRFPHVFKSETQRMVEKWTKKD